MPKNKIQFQKGMSLLDFNKAYGTNEQCEAVLYRYFAEFCYRFNRRFRLGSMISSLACAAVNSKPIPQHQLMLAEYWW